MVLATAHVRSFWKFFHFVNQFPRPTRFCLRLMSRVFVISVSSHLNIFDSIISPILNNAEVWGVYIKNDFNNWDKLPVEKVHLKFCKLYLGVGRKTSNIASRSELGKHPLIINIFKRIFKYIALILTHLLKQLFPNKVFSCQNIYSLKRAILSMEKQWI